jgi:hypothetical protein
MRGVSAIVLVSQAIPDQELNVVTSAAGAGAGHAVKITSKASADSPITPRPSWHVAAGPGRCVSWAARTVT